MHIQISEVFVICVIAALCWYVNVTFNTVPILNKIITAIIVVVSVLLLLQSFGLINSHISINS